MATKTLTVCDWDEHAEDEDILADHQRTYFVGETEYEIDLCDGCEPKFRAFQQLTERWRSSSRQKAAPSQPRSPSRSSGDRAENAAIREWAKAQPDIELGERGRIPDDIRARYRAARASSNGHRVEPITPGSLR